MQELPGEAIYVALQGRPQEASKTSAGLSDLPSFLGLLTKFCSLTFCRFTAKLFALQTKGKIYQLHVIKTPVQVWVRCILYWNNSLCSDPKPSVSQKCHSGLRMCYRIRRKAMAMAMILEQASREQLALLKQISHTSTPSPWWDPPASCQNYVYLIIAIYLLNKCQNPLCWEMCEERVQMAVSVIALDSSFTSYSMYLWA